MTDILTMYTAAPHYFACLNFFNFKFYSYGTFPQYFALDAGLTE